MGFYEEISKYYDYIFPVSTETVDFLIAKIGSRPKSILDVACGTGGYSLELEKHGYNMTAVDLDKAMIEGLREKALSSGSKVKYLQANMLELKEKLPHKGFDVVFCIGNSVVHLDNNNEISEFFNNTKSVLSDNGTLIIQTINFDRVLSKGITSLPTIFNDTIGLKFERLYRYDHLINKVFFKTILTVEDKKIENEIPLTPLKFDETEHMLKKAGFTDIAAFGGFDGSEFQNENSFLMIIKAKKSSQKVGVLV
jgi:2-polyprenyl-3-methyl-5-hydroxy-6-metoxy-1,4-benzoquinol methylase